MKMMSITLGENSEFERMRLAFARLGMSPAEIDDLLPPLQGDNAPELPDLTALLGLDKGRLNEKPTDTAQNDLLPDLLVTRSSNNWVISGDRTDTGKPILANDPHLDLTAPSVWYLAHMRIEGADGTATNMVGVSQPGVPLILLGRNDNVAWGFTNTRSDVQDIFVEKINPANDGQYLTPDGWKPFETKEEVIRIKDGEDYHFTRRRTRHGPVLPTSYANLDLYLPKNTVAALQWVALAEDDLTFEAGVGTWTVKTVQEFQNGMVDYVTPMQSMVVADRSGNIGFIAPGRVPLRDAQNLVMGRAPVPGWDPVYDWKGTIPFQGLPRSLNPPDGAIATANTRMVGPSYPFFLTYDWDEPWRQERIDELVVNSDVKQTTDMSRKVQADVHSLAFAALVPEMVALVEGRDDVDKDAIGRMKSWNYDMTLDGAEPLIFMAWLRQSIKMIYSDDLGPAFDPWFKARVMPLERLFAGKTARDWCDDRSTPPKDSCADMLAESLKGAISLLDNLYGTNRDEWSWGRAHPTAGKHTPFSDIPVLKSFFNVQVPNVGGQFTIDRGVPDFTNVKAPFVNTEGASYRAVYDLSDLDKSTYMITTGQSGNPFSKHYRDMAKPWAAVKSFVIPTDPAVFEKTTAGVWHLSPTGE
jgi:penicillin amidase